MSDFCVEFYPQGKRIDVKKGTTLLEAASRAGITINSACGGEGICKNCKMIILKGLVSRKKSDKITQDGKEGDPVLSCMTYVEDDLSVRIPEGILSGDRESMDEDAQRFIEKEFIFQREEYEASPLVKKIFLRLKRPTLTDHTADHQRVSDALEKKLETEFLKIDLKTLKEIPEILRENDYCVTVTAGLSGNINKILSVEGGDTTKRNYSVVVDIGTTTIVANLIDCSSFGIVDAKACFNAQGMYGREVTGRIISAEKKGVKELQKLVVKSINTLISGLVNDNKINRNDINALVCSGNTIMLHFLLGLETKNIRRSPYIPSTVEPLPVSAIEAGIRINPDGLVYSLPCISGWVGGDITAGIFSTGMDEKEEISLLIDMGTNGEIAVGNKEWIITCSASAGPALEGAGVECGMRAERGAIEKVFLKKNKISYKTIGDFPAKGICGSGIVDLVSVLLESGIIDRSGKFIKSGTEKFFVSDKIYITEPDLENIITAKAAIYAALKIILKKLNLRFGDIGNLFIAGAFGNYINKESAVSIGLIPSLPRERIKFVGNTSIRGARFAALYKDAFFKIREIGRKTTYYDLMGAIEYVEEFKKAMFLPHTDVEEFYKNHGEK